MSKRALKRQLREGAFDAGQFEGDDKIRRLPIDRGWSPLPHHHSNDDREQAYLKTVMDELFGRKSRERLPDPDGGRLRAGWLYLTRKVAPPSDEDASLRDDFLDVARAWREERSGGPPV